MKVDPQEVDPQHPQEVEPQEVDPQQWLEGDPQEVDLQLRLEEMVLFREDQRECRQEMTSEELSKGGTLGYVFDEAAVAACNDDMKSWIESAVAAGYGIVVKGNLGLDCSIYESVLEDVSELIEGLRDDDVISSLYALFLACSDIFDDYGDSVFVTGNKKMLKLIEEEGSREELHDAVHARGFPGVHYYMVINNQGQLARANLKWDDHTRPSDQRLVHGFADKELALCCLRKGRPRESAFYNSGSE